MPDPSSPVDRWGDRLMAVFWRRPAPTLAERTRRRVTLHLLPYLFFLYILAYVDRMNIAVAGLAMKSDPPKGLGIDVKGLGMLLFFLGYWILEIPSTLWVERHGARWVFARILVLWGIVAALMGGIGQEPVNTLFSWTPWLFAWVPHSADSAGWLADVARFADSLPHDARNQFYVLRFLLGFFEGGFFPSVIVYLSHWFRQQDRARALAAFSLAMPLSSVISFTFGALFVNGLNGWRWIFVIEGALPVLAGFSTIFLLPDRPHKSKWLPDDEREWLVEQLRAEHEQKLLQTHFGWRGHLGMVLLLTIVYFCQNMVTYGLSTYMPSVMKNLAPPGTRDDATASLLATLPYFMALVGMLINGWHSDRKQERAWHAAVPLTVMSLGIVGVWWFFPNPAFATLVLVFVVGTCIYTHIPPFWSIPTMFLGAGAAASAIGFINMVGNIGSGCGPYILGKVAEGADFGQALLRLAPWSFAAAVIVMLMEAVRRRGR
jgi:sugar phosphate permease